MPNFFRDNDDLQFLFEHLDLAGIATIQEDDFRATDGPGSEYAPVDAADAMDNYRRILDIVETWRATRSPRGRRTWTTRATT